MSELKPHFPCNPLDSEPQPAPKLAPAKAPATAALDDYFGKLASEILDRTIFRLGQDAAPVVAAPVAPAQSSDSHCLSVIEDSIKWFLQRANAEFDALYGAWNGTAGKPDLCQVHDQIGKVRLQINMMLNLVSFMPNKWKVYPMLGMI